VPYTGATGAVNLGSQSLTAGTITSNGNTVATVVDPVRTTLTGDGVLSTFAISGASGLVNPSALIVAIDGALQEPTVDYTVGSGQITFTSPLASGAKAVVISPTNSLQVSQMIPADGSVSSSKLANNIEVSGELSVNGQTVLGALDDNNVVTAKHSRFLCGYKNVDMLRHPWATQASTGTVGIAYNNYGLVLNASSSSLSGRITATARNPATSGGVEPVIGDAEVPSSYGGISFTKPMVIHFGLRSGGQEGWSSLSSISAAVAIGTWDSAITSDISSLQQTNTGATRGYVTVLLENGSVYIVTQKANNAKQTSAELDTYSSAFFVKHYSLVIENSVAYLYSNGVLLGSVSGAPDGSVTGPGGLFANISSTIVAPTNQFRLYIPYLNITWD
jgi:hypothetical protein